MTELAHHDLNEAWTVQATFKVGTVPTDPTTVAATLRKPSGAIVAYAYPGANIAHGTAGVFTVSDVGAEVGVHYLEVVGTGAAAGRERWSFVVDPRWPADLLNPNALTTIEAVDLLLDRVGTQGTRGQEEDDKRVIADLINDYSKLVLDYSQREFQPVTVDANPDVARVFLYDGDSLLSLAPYEIRVITSVTVYSDLPAALRGPTAGVLTNGYDATGLSFYGSPRQKTPEGTFTELELPELSSGSRSYSTWGGGLPSLGAGSRWVEVTVVGKWGAGVVPIAVKRVVETAVANAFWSARERDPQTPSADYLIALDARAEEILDLYSNRSPFG